MNKLELCRKIKKELDNLNQNELEEVFKIIYKTNNNYSKNNEGVIINLSWINEEILEQIYDYIKFCIKSHNEINKYEILCNNFSDVINNKVFDAHIHGNGNNGSPTTPPFTPFVGV